MSTLYYQANNPFSQRVLLAFAYVQPVCEMVEVGAGVAQGMEPKAAMLPEGVSADALPVLLADGEQMDNSLEIMDWALDQKEDNSWVDWDLDEMDDSLYILSLCDEPFNDYLHEYLSADTAEARFAAAECGVGFLKQLDELLAGSRYLLKDEPMLVDYAVLPFIVQFIQQEPEFWEDNLPARLSAWLQSLLADSVCQAVFS